MPRYIVCLEILKNKYAKINKKQVLLYEKASLTASSLFEIYLL